MGGSLSLIARFPDRPPVKLSGIGPLDPAQPRRALQRIGWRGLGTGGGQRPDAAPVVAVRTSAADPAPTPSIARVSSAGAA